ncbi:divergent polysaccharide deacetylase family protein [Photobacterium nomapromontoriensis]|uniref:divergent polysaccharide deacetylase family protein n=1 Tax=Photobacterium nomapromontoriensis TaxID=2910237 RepID=UPI003D0D2578
MRRIAFWITLLLLASLPTLVQAARLAIIIDDLGYRAMPPALSALPSEVSISILPGTPFDAAISQLARKQQRDILLHMPMEPSRNVSLEHATLTRSMTKETLQLTLQQALNRIPDIIAVNNHMGSALTQDPTAMGWVMDVLAHQGLSFLDSRTSAQSVAFEQAISHQVPVLRRDVFLDHFRSEAFVKQQLTLAAKHAKRHGYAIAIGHPYPVTLTTIKQQLPSLAAQGITLVRLSDLYPPS